MSENTNQSNTVIEYKTKNPDINYTILIASCEICQRNMIKVVHYGHHFICNRCLHRIAWSVFDTKI